MKVAEKLKEAAKNNRKKIVIGGAVIFIGCAGAYMYMSKQGGGASTNSTQGQVQGQETASSTDIKRPDRDPDIMGIVESVNGNEIKILKLDASSMPGANKSGNGSGQNSGANGSSQNADKGNMQPPADMAQGAQRQSGSTSGKNMQSEMLAELKKKSTGEETVVVPVGIQMLKMGGGQPAAGGNRPSGNNNDTGSGNAKPNGDNAGNKQQGGGEVEATISDITANKMVMIWLNADVTDRKVAEFVSITR